MKYLAPILAQFKALKTRERVLVVAAAVGVLYFVFDIGWIRPQKAEAKVLQARLAQQAVELEALNKALRTLTAQRPTDPLASQRAERDELLNTTTQAELLISRANANVRTGDVIRSFVASRPGLTLVSLRTLPSEVFFQPPAVPPAGGASGAKSSPPSSGAPTATTTLAPVPALYRHGIEITVQGNFLTLMPYLQQLQRETDGIFWSGAKLDVVGYPDVTLKMTIYTLSARPELPVG